MITAYLFLCVVVTVLYACYFFAYLSSSKDILCYYFNNTPFGVNLDGFLYRMEKSTTCFRLLVVR